MKIYRVTTGGTGVFMAIRFSPLYNQYKESLEKASWFPQVGELYPGAVSFWTEEGFETYKTTGLYNLHLAILADKKIDIRELEIKEDEPSILYQDSLQVIIQK